MRAPARFAFSITRAIAAALIAICAASSAAAAQQPGTLNLRVYSDLNANGVADAGEPGLFGWSFQVKRGNTTVQSNTTNTSGATTVTGAAGSYSVKMLLKTGWTGTSTNTKSANLVANGTETVEFGVVAPAGGGAGPSNLPGSLRVQVGKDNNGQTLGVLVGWTLTVSGGALTQPVTMLSTSAWAVQSLDAGTYSVVVTPKTGWTSTGATTQSVSITANTPKSVFFGFKPAAP